MKPEPIEEARAILDRLPTKYAALAALGVSCGGRISELLTMRRCDLIDSQKMTLRDEIRIVKLKSRPKRTINERLDKIEQRIEDINAPRNIFGNRLSQPIEETKRTTPKQYRRFMIPQALRHYIERHLNEEARKGYIKTDDYVFRGTNGNRLNPRSVYKFFSEHIGEKHGTHWMRKTYAEFMYQIFTERYGGDTFRAAREVQTLLGHKSIDTTAKYLQMPTIDRDAVIQAAFDRAFK